MSRFCRCKRPTVKSSSRPYHKCVLVGNWYEDRVLEEDVVKDYLYKREHGELNWQKMNSVTKLCLRPTRLTRNSDQYLRYGNRVMILNHQHLSGSDLVRSLCLYVPDDVLYQKDFTDSILDQPPKNLSASSVVMSPSAISTFVVRGLHGAQDGTPVLYGDRFYIYTSNEKLLMMSLKRNPLFECPIRSKSNWTAMVSTCSWNCAWKATPFDPRDRLELDGEPVKCNTRILLSHIESNESLAVEEDVTIRTPFGADKEVACRTKRGSYGVEEPSNHWVFYKDCPGKEKYPVMELPPED